MAAKDLASSSSSSGSKAKSSYSYDVFINFRGEDTRRNFTGFLHRALTDKGINVFLDSENLPTGEEISPALKKAIEGSRISIPVFSTRYADSKWCLRELAQIVECHRSNYQIILPIFFYVDPSDVRNQTGRFGNAFLEYRNNFAPHEIESWRETLRVVGNLKGEVVDDTKYQVDTLDLVVRRVLKELVNSTSLAECNYCIDMESRLYDLLSLLNIGSNDVQFVGICGCGGIGKTTLAKAVYNDIFSTFDKHCFLSDIKEQTAQFGGLASLQKKFLKDILKVDFDIGDSHTRTKLIEERGCREKVLLVLDNVDSKEQIDALAGSNWFGYESRVIITTRDEHLLKLAKVKRDKIYRPPLLGRMHSLQLFSWHAFERDQPQEDYLELSSAIVDITGGLPLALQVIGSSLFSKDKPIWEDKLNKLRNVPDSNVMKTLKISYDDGLDPTEQQMFLDIACFFIGMKKDIVSYIWESCGFFPRNGLNILCAKSLITINENDEIRMHDVLRDLGREIVRQENTIPEERSRIWSKREVLDVFVKGKGTSKCMGLAIDLKNEPKSEYLINEALDAMTGLRLLQIDHVEILGKCRNSFSELRWLSWKASCSKPSILSWLSWEGHDELFALTNFHPKNLVVLDLSESMMNEKWMGWKHIKMALNLKVLKLDFCENLRHAPDFSGNRLLEILSLKYCKNLVTVHASMADLRKLVTLDMTGCPNLVDLPIVAFELASLETLNLHQCSSLRKLPDNLNSLTSLTALRISGCDDRYYPRLPPSLTILSFHECHSLRRIPHFPPSLTSLSVVLCKSVRYIPGLPSSLKSLGVDRCYLLQKLSSASERGLSNLKTLSVDDCGKLEEIEGADNKLESLEQFQVQNCNSLKRLPKLSCSKNLLGLRICGADILSDFEGEGMDSLEQLKIKHCYSLKRIPYLRDSKWLRELHIDGCLELMEIEHLESYESLQILFISQLLSLRTLSEDISALKNLTHLYILCCMSMESLPDLSNLEELRDLTISDCEKLQEIRGLDRLELLQELSVKDCKNLERLPDLSKLKSLWKLNIAGTKLSEILGLHGLESLQELAITNCHNLTEIRGVESLKSLETLCIKECCSLERLPDLSNFEYLWEGMYSRMQKSTQASSLVLESAVPSSPESPLAD